MSGIIVEANDVVDIEEVSELFNGYWSGRTCMLCHLHRMTLGGVIGKTIGSGMLCLNDANIVK